MKSCLDGYLTRGCANCPDWHDDDNSIGCGTHSPISWCPYYREMVKFDNFDVGDIVEHTKRKITGTVKKKDESDMTILVEFGEGTVKWCHINELSLEWKVKHTHSSLDDYDDVTAMPTCDGRP